MTDCEHCGQTPEVCQESQIETAASHLMMIKLRDTLPKDYAETLDAILIDWRTHTLPECDPLAIS